jgi:hypothetical protein
VKLLRMSKVASQMLESMLSSACTCMLLGYFAIRFPSILGMRRGSGQSHRSFSQDIAIIAWCSNGFLVLFFLNNRRALNP